MSEPRPFSVKMRASRGGEHVSGAERIVTPSATPETASALVRRALGHSKGDPDFISLKVAATPGIVAELCISDDPDYVIGYVASRTTGYRRITCMKEMGDTRGGRIFVCRGIAGDPSNTIRFLEETPVLVEDIPMPDGSARGNRLDGIKRELDAIRTSGLWQTHSETLQGSPTIALAQPYAICEISK